MAIKHKTNYLTIAEIGEQPFNDRTNQLIEQGYFPFFGVSVLERGNSFLFVQQFFRTVPIGEIITVTEALRNAVQKVIELDPSRTDPKINEVVNILLQYKEEVEG